MTETNIRLDRLQHMIELLMAENHLRRLEKATPPEGPTRWSAEGFPILPRNLLVDFSADAPVTIVDPDAYLASGWYARETWGVWGHGADQTIRFALDNYRGGYVTIHLTVRNFLPPGAPPPDIDISANGYFLGSHPVGARLKLLRLRLPPSCIGDGDILLQLQHHTPLSPGSFTGNTDPRLLGVGLSSVAIT